MSAVYQCVISLLASLCFGILFQVRGVKLLVAGMGGLISWLVYLLSAPLSPGSTIPRYFLATLVITAFAEGCARLLRAPVSVFLAIALIPLVPGGGIYRTMLYCIRGETAQALEECVGTFGIAGALAMGIVTVSSAVHLVLKAKNGK